MLLLHAVACAAAHATRAHANQDFLWCDRFVKCIEARMAGWLAGAFGVLHERATASRDRIASKAHACIVHVWRGGGGGGRGGRAFLLFLYVGR